MVASWLLVGSLIRFVLCFILQNPEGKPAWLESVIAIPTENYREDFVEPGKVDKSPQFADECSQNSFYIDSSADGRSTITSTIHFPRDLTYPLLPSPNPHSPEL